jgi:hypothetical protein
VSLQLTSCDEKKSLWRNLLVTGRLGDGERTMKLPTWMSIVCRADGSPIAGAYIDVTVKVRRKNDFPVLAGPTDVTGVTLVTREQIEESADWHKRAFLMDYTGLGDATGEIVVTPKNREHLDAALRAYELYHRYLPFPAGYQEKLLKGKGVLNKLAPATLSVEVEHDGEGITIRTIEMPA